MCLAYVCPYVVNISHFQLLQNHFMPSHQTYHNCSSRGSEEVLYLFEAIRNTRWLSWPLIGRDIFSFFSRTTACDAGRLAKNIPLEVLMNCLIHDGRPGLWLVEIFWTSFPENCMLYHQIFQKYFFRGTNVFFQGENLISAATSHKIN